MKVRHYIAGFNCRWAGVGEWCSPKVCMLMHDQPTILERINNWKVLKYETLYVVSYTVLVVAMFLL